VTDRLSRNVEKSEGLEDNIKLNLRQIIYQNENVTFVCDTAVLTPINLFTKIYGVRNYEKINFVVTFVRP